MKQKNLTKTVMMISNFKKPLVSMVYTEVIQRLINHNPLKHHFTSLKTDLIFLQQRVLERKFP